MKPHVSIPWLRVLVEPYLKCEQYTCVLIKGKEKKRCICAIFIVLICSFREEAGREARQVCVGNI